MPRPPATSSRCRLRGSTSNGRPSGPSMSTSSPGRSRVNHSVPAADDPEVDRDDAGRRVGGVDRERPAQDHPGEVAGPDVDELAGPRAGRELRRVVGLEPLARTGSRGSRRAPPRRAAWSRGRAVLRALVVGARRLPRRRRPRRPPRRRRRRPRRRRSARGVLVVRATPPGRPRRGRRPGRRRRRSGRRTRRARPRRTASATRRRPPRGRPRRGTRRSAVRTRRSSSSSTMTRSPTSAAALGGGRLELVEQARLAALAALLVLEGEVVQAARGRLVVARARPAPAGRRPTSRPRRRTDPRRARSSPPARCRRPRAGRRSRSARAPSPAASRAASAKAA